MGCISLFYYDFDFQTFRVNALTKENVADVHGFINNTGNFICQKLLTCNILFYLKCQLYNNNSVNVYFVNSYSVFAFLVNIYNPPRFVLIYGRHEKGTN